MTTYSLGNCKIPSSPRAQLQRVGVALNSEHKFSGFLLRMSESTRRTNCTQHTIPVRVVPVIMKKALAVAILLLAVQTTFAVEATYDVCVIGGGPAGKLNNQATHCNQC